MRNSLKLLQEGREILWELQKHKAVIEVSAEQLKSIKKYANLMELKLGLYYYNDKEPSFDFMMLRKKYEHLDSTNIDKAINVALNEANDILGGVV